MTHHHTQRLSRDLTDLTWYCGVVLIAVDILNTGDVQRHNKPTGQIFSSEFGFKIIILKPENQKYQENSVDFHDGFAVKTEHVQELKTTIHQKPNILNILKITLG